MGGQGGVPQGGVAGTGGTGGSDTGPIGGVPNVTPQNATSVPASYGTPIANPGTWTGKMYEAYYYNENGSAADIFKPPVKQSTPVMKPLLFAEGQYSKVRIPGRNCTLAINAM